MTSRNDAPGETLQDDASDGSLQDDASGVTPLTTPRPGLLTTSQATPGTPVPLRPAALALWRSRTIPWFFAGPAAALFLVFFAYPLAASFAQSLQTTDGGITRWAGAEQYTRMLDDPSFLRSLVNAGLILLVQVPIMIGLALVLAYVLNQSWLRFRATLRTAYFLPAVTTLVAYAVVFRVLLRTEGGAVNQVLGAQIDWLNDPFPARIALIASVTWRWTGYNAIILLAGLQAVGREQYEAAAIDGAGPLTTFLRVILPQLRPVVLFCSITSTIGTLQLFDEPLVLTGGGPSDATLTPILYLYQVGFRQFDFGYAAAIAWVVVALIGGLSHLQFRYFGRERS
ncbi:sugar ABC transporter permease [Streptosporangium sp. NPDC051023]|uniref:carbohydrate ABC transporter permease n=1 Tax=Streptosporangium sp. NPDC051023 TaxID=3155410 RepID=UPI00344D463D